MAKKQQGREAGSSRTIGEKPHAGRRYVENGRVRIEWYENGKRRRKSFGEDSPKARSKADTALEEILTQMRDATGEERRSAEKGEPAAEPETVTAEALARSLALSLMDTADRMAEWLRPEK